MGARRKILGGSLLPDNVRLLSRVEQDALGLAKLSKEKKDTFCAWAQIQGTEQVGLLKKCSVDSFIKDQLAAFFAAAVELCFPVPVPVWGTPVSSCFVEETPFYLFSPVLGARPQIVSRVIHENHEKWDVLDPLLPCQMSSSLPLCWLFDNNDGRTNNIVLSHADPQGGG